MKFSSTDTEFRGLLFWYFCSSIRMRCHFATSGTGRQLKAKSLRVRKSSSGCAPSVASRATQLRSVSRYCATSTSSRSPKAASVAGTDGLQGWMSRRMA